MQHPIRSTPALSRCALHPRRAALLALVLLSSACSQLPLAVDLPVGTSPPVVGAGDRSPTANPLRGARLYVNPSSQARKKVDELRHSRPGDAALLEKIASQPQAIWFGDWYPEPYQIVRQMTDQITAAGALPVYVLYSIPLRDCGQYSAGGAGSPAAYQRWISEVARAIGGRRALVVLEPDAVAGMDCLSPAQQGARLEMLHQAIRTLKSHAGTLVYLDAGNAGWHPASVVAERLRRAGVDQADGFALNVAGYIGNEPSVAFGGEVSRLIGGKHFVIDTSRNGLGAAPGNEWCNASGRALGTRPTTATGHTLVDAYLWIKNPGESDGTCNGGPPAGQWWVDYALGLARRASW